MLPHSMTWITWLEDNGLARNPNLQTSKQTTAIL